ncbi:hypothetical protein [Romboutsia hominis]|uniref:Uncharacterized protein n=1 Tax=Romboutsia hominis TaxID=1507512 RepID=A0A2P2BRD8_9FIRM|nr:hypothetical protein [Romboutsia hominis]CEI72916.1 Hypothetical protein FRIFI_1381 [Romboutsia hominis]
MEYLGDSYVSLKYKKEYFNRLNLDLSSNHEEWNIAIDIFDDRIRGRYLNVIESMIRNNNINRDGFAIMALNCLLIETLLQFKRGWNETRGSNKQAYTNFLLEEFPSHFSSPLLAEIFYTHIRCGILHSAQTKKGSKLTFNKSYVVSFDENNLSVDVENITIMINTYYDNYLCKLRDENNIDIRKKFLKKMKFLCDR